MRSIKSRPRADSFRRPDAVIEPSGKATAAATGSRSGMSGLIASRGGRCVRGINTSYDAVHAVRGRSIHAALPRGDSLLSLPTERAGQVNWVTVGFVSRQGYLRGDYIDSHDDAIWTILGTLL